MSQNKVQPWMKDAAQVMYNHTRARRELYDKKRRLGTDGFPWIGTNDVEKIIAAHAPASAPLSALEREVKEKWDAVHDGKCKCTEFVLCDACRSNHSLCTFVQLNSYRIAEALVKRLPTEEK